MTTTRTNPLSHLTDQLNELKAKGTHFKLRVLEDEQAPVCTFDETNVCVWICGSSARDVD